ncbi:MAG: hypothetical protein AAFQ27_05895 [Pseudomonadota bacterium]
MTYIKNIVLSVFVGVLAYFLFVAIALAFGVTDVSLAKVFAIVSAVAFAIVLVVSQNSRRQADG